MSDLDEVVEELQERINEGQRERFSEKVIREFWDPQNVGRIEDTDFKGKLQGQCGDTMEFSIEMKDGRIQRILFATDGCGPSIACGSMTTRLAEGKTIEEALQIRDGDILKALDGLPKENEHCAKLAAVTLTRAIRKGMAAKVGMKK